MQGSRRSSAAGPAAAAVAALLFAACSSSHNAAAPGTTLPSTTAAPAATTTTAPATAPVPTGPVAGLSGPVTGGKGVSLLAASTPDLRKAGYQENEYFASGTATSYTAAGPQGGDGRWSVQASATAAYKTRVIVRAPADPAKFNGTVLVEWLNVTAGSDTAADFSYLSPEILRAGYAWVGVSAQKVGVMGGGGGIAVASAPSGGLRGTDPVRYGSLNHPGDAYSFDIYSQIGRAIRKPGSVDALGGLHPQRVIAMGESQSAHLLTTYIDAINPQARVYDGFFVHSRGVGAFALAGGLSASGVTGAVQIRDDVNVPVLLIETETDEMGLGYFNARQPDSAHIRLWDLAGASHADAFLVGTAASVLGCKGAINEAPTHYVLNAALYQLDQWVRSGNTPPSAPRMDVVLQNGKPVVQRDSLGVAIGGVRSAGIDVPVAAYSGVPGDSSSALCFLFGSTHPFDAATVHRLYPTKDAYVSAFTKALDKAIASGYVLSDDRAEMLAQAQQVQI